MACTTCVLRWGGDGPGSDLATIAAPGGGAGGRWRCTCINLWRREGDCLRLPMARQRQEVATCNSVAEGGWREVVYQGLSAIVCNDNRETNKRLRAPSALLLIVHIL